MYYDTTLYNSDDSALKQKVDAIENVAQKLKSGEMFSKYRMELAGAYARRKDAYDHASNLRREGVPALFIDNHPNYYVFVRRKQFASGGALSGEWVLYNPKTDEVISIHKSHRSAKMAMDKAWNKGEHDELGIEAKSEFDKWHNFEEGGLVHATGDWVTINGRKTKILNAYTDKAFGDRVVYKVNVPMYPDMKRSSMTTAIYTRDDSTGELRKIQRSDYVLKDGGNFTYDNPSDKYTDKVFQDTSKSKYEQHFFRVVGNFGRQINYKWLKDNLRAKMGQRTDKMERSDLEKGLKSGKYKAVERKEDGGFVTSIESFTLPASDVTPIGQGGIPNYNTPLDVSVLNEEMVYEKGGTLKANDLAIGTKIKHKGTGVTVSVYNVNPETGLMQCERDGVKFPKWVSAKNFELVKK